MLTHQLTNLALRKSAINLLIFYFALFYLSPEISMPYFKWFGFDLKGDIVGVLGGGTPL